MDKIVICTHLLYIIVLKLWSDWKVRCLLQQAEGFNLNCLKANLDRQTKFKGLHCQMQCKLYILVFAYLILLSIIQDQTYKYCGFRCQIWNNRSLCNRQHVNHSRNIITLYCTWDFITTLRGWRKLSLKTPRQFKAYLGGLKRPGGLFNTRVIGEMTR